jgi:hypothetical protein
LKNKRNVKEIIYDVLENTLCGRKDSELEERDYYLYDRGDFSKRYFRDDDRYDDDIESVSTYIKQMELFGEIIYVDEMGKIMNSNVDDELITENMRVEDLRIDVGDVGLIFLKFVYDRVGSREKVKYLNEFRKLFIGLLNDKGENVEELSMNLNTMKKDMVKDLEDDLSDDIKVGVVDDYVFKNTKEINKFVEKIGFDRNSMESFFQNVIN